MTPIVNDRYKYIMCYSAKVGCTSMRILYLSMHAAEMSEEQHANLRGYHNLNQLFPFEVDKDYSDYFAFIITRNPYSRVVSAFIDQYAYAKNSGVLKMLAEHPPQTGEPQTFLEFLEYLKRVPDCDRDSHFQTQSYFAHAASITNKKNRLRQWLGRSPTGHLNVSYSGDISGFASHMTEIYQKVFEFDESMLSFAREKINEVQHHNSTFYGEQDFADAAQLSVAQLDELKFAPKPQDFFNSKQVRDLVDDIYKSDFDNYGYSRDEIPHKLASKEVALVPEDMDWQMYLRLNPDLPPNNIYNERTVLRHYLEFGRFEAHPRAYKIEAPEGFDWRRYLSLHGDLSKAGITTESAAIEHYISYGIREEREI